MAVSIYKPPKLELPPVPAPPPGDFGQNGRPNLASEQATQRNIDALPSLYAPGRSLAKAQLQEGLKPYGDMYTFAQDDPNTPEDESLGVEFNPNSRGGSAIANAYRNVRGSHAARGTLYSSYTDRDIGTEASRISEQARKMVMQYGSGINESAVAESKDRNAYYADLRRDYGADSEWLADQVPPAPKPSPGSGGILTWKQWLAYHKITNANAATADRWRKYVLAHGGQLPPPANANNETA